MGRKTIDSLPYPKYALYGLCLPKFFILFPFPSEIVLTRMKKYNKIHPFREISIEHQGKKCSLLPRI